MMRVAAALAFAVMVTAAHAQSVKLRASEIDILLSGNTAAWQAGGVSYRQYFDANGETVFAANSVPLMLGDWRVDDTADEFQSLWSGDTEWEGWYVMEYDGDWFWVSKSTPPTSFEILDGNQLVTQ